LIDEEQTLPRRQALQRLYGGILVQAVSQSVDDERAPGAPIRGNRGLDDEADLIAHPLPL